MALIFCVYFLFYAYLYLYGWLGGVVIRAPDSRSADRGFDSRPRHCRATTLGKLFTPVCLCLPSSIKPCPHCPQSHFSATVWTGLKLVPCEGFHVNAPYVAAMAWVQ